MSPLLIAAANAISISIDLKRIFLFFTFSLHLLNEININTYFTPNNSATIEATSAAASFGKYAVSLMPEITRVIS